MNKHNIWKCLIWVFVPFLLLSTACGGRGSRQVDEAAVIITVTAESTQAGQTNLGVTLVDPAGQPVNDAVLSIKGDMSHAGMVPVLAEAAAGENGVYQFPFEWTMAGDWVVTVEAKLKDGRTVTRQFGFTITN